MIKVSRLTVLLTVVFLGLGTVACERLPERAPADATLTFDKPELEDAIPLDYGELVAITPSGSSEHTALLWFEQPDKTIRVVYVNVTRGVMADRVMKIERR